jgi:hypothetical protein
VPFKKQRIIDQNQILSLFFKQWRRERGRAEYIFNQIKEQYQLLFKPFLKNTKRKSLWIQNFKFRKKK